MGIAVGLTVLAGLAGAVQVAVLGRFGSRIGIVEALAFATGVQLLLAVTVLLVAGQFARGAVIDRFGLFGVEQIGISWPGALGIGLLAVGSALSLLR